MFDNYEMTVVKIEGLGNISKSYCKVSVNDQPIETIQVKDLDGQQHVITIPAKGCLRICVEDQLLLASLRFNLRIIKCEGYHWLPLFIIPQDTIFEVPEEVGLPRVLLIFQARKFLSPVIEITETSEVSENIDLPDVQDTINEDGNNTLELRMKILQLEHSLHFEKVNNVQSIENLQNEFKASTKTLVVEMDKYKLWSEKYKERVALLSEELESKNNKIQNLTEVNSILNAELDLYKKKYSELISSQETLNKLLKSKEDELSSLNSVYPKHLIIEKVQTTEIQKSKLKKQRPRLINLSVEKTIPEESSKPVDSDADQVDFHLQSSLSLLKLEGFFQKTPEFYYKVGNKLVGVVLKKNNIYCKFGESYKTLESYIFTQCNNELEIFIKKRANVKPGHRKTNTLTTSFDKTMTISRSFRIEGGSSLKSVKNKSITPCLANRKKNKGS